MQTWLLIDIIAFVVMALVGVFGVLYFVYFKEIVPLRWQAARKKKQNYILVEIIRRDKTIEYHIARRDDVGLTITLRGQKDARHYKIPAEYIVYDPAFDIQKVILYEEKLTPVPPEPDVKDSDIFNNVQTMVYSILKAFNAQMVDMLPTIYSTLRLLKILTLLTVIGVFIAAAVSGYGAYILTGIQHILGAGNGAVQHAATTAAKHVAEVNTVVRR